MLPRGEQPPGGVGKQRGNIPQLGVGDLEPPPYPPKVLVSSSVEKDLGSI